ncbi:MAG: diaminopimelate decarboxylase [Oscillospiraceae bacterium]|nr:diaminopimelate decarboxylase [Oscillospiraceae bacterium]
MIATNITRDEQGALYFAEQSVAALAEQYGTPLYLMDEERIRRNCGMYREALKEVLGENALALYAGKAASFKQIYRITREEGMGVDAVSPGEIHTAISAGVSPEKIFYHGDGKTDADIRYAMAQQVGCFVVDNVSELLAVNAEARRTERKQKVLLRITPGIDPHTYHEVNTGSVDVKFGAAIETGQAFAFVQEALEMDHLDVQGLHCHVGSEVFSEDVFERCVDVMVAFMKKLKVRLNFCTNILDVGGGYGVRYVDSDPDIDIPARVAEVARHLQEKTEEAGLPVPFFLMEPGRSIVADAGMTVYTVVNVKRIPGFKSYVTIDGGMTDNPRYCLYGARYTAMPVNPDDGRKEIFDLAGRCCENGDIIQPSLLLPIDISRGDYLAVCTTGAYNYSMASNYNRYGKPPIVMLKDGMSYVAVERETIEDVCARDI